MISMCGRLLMVEKGCPIEGSRCTGPLEQKAALL